MKEVDAMLLRRQNLDLRVHDHAVLDEIELYSEMLIAVATTERSLTTEEIDRVLGVRPEGTGRESTPQE
jgi:hypothetical protein